MFSVYDVRLELPPIAATSMITPTSPDAPSARMTPLSAAASSCVGRPSAVELRRPLPLDCAQGGAPAL